MANSNPCVPLENEQLARSSNEHNPPEDHAAGELASAYMTERSDARRTNPQEENGAQEETVAGPAFTSLDPSSDLNKGTALEKGAASDLPCSSMDRSSDAVNNAPADADVVVKGIASVLGPVMNHFDSGVEAALKSQSILATSIDRLTGELDKLLEDVPLPFAMHHATRLSGIRKRVLNLNMNLRKIQRRMETIQRFLTGYASKAVAKGNQGRSSMENSNSALHGPFPQGGAPYEVISTSSADADKQGDGGLLHHSQIRSQEQHDDPGA